MSSCATCCSTHSSSRYFSFDLVSGLASSSPFIFHLCATPWYYRLSYLEVLLFFICLYVFFCSPVTFTPFVVVSNGSLGENHPLRLFELSYSHTLKLYGSWWALITSFPRIKCSFVDRYLWVVRDCYHWIDFGSNFIVGTVSFFFTGPVLFWEVATLELFSYLFGWLLLFDQLFPRVAYYPKMFIVS